MGFWLTVLILLLVYFVIKLILLIIEENRAKVERAEIPGKVGILNLLTIRKYILTIYYSIEWLLFGHRRWLL